MKWMSRILEVSCTVAGGGEHASSFIRDSRRGDRRSRSSTRQQTLPMPRPSRLVMAGLPLHVVQRGNNRTRTFWSSDDFGRFKELLFDASTRFCCAIHAYVFMTNHVHMLLTPGDDVGPSRMMQAVGSRYAHFINTRRHRTGTLWEARYRSSHVNADRYFLVCSRYIELNPVRAGMVDEPRDYQWSSHRHNAYGIADPLITAHELFQSLGTCPADRHEAYRDLFAESDPPDTLEAIRKAVNRGDLLGDGGFRQTVRSSLLRSTARRPHGGDRRSDRFRATQPPLQGL